MLGEKFDAYGELLPDLARDGREAASAPSAMLNRIGQYVFWLLVIVIVSARIIYYPANRVFEFRSVSQANPVMMR